MRRVRRAVLLQVFWGGKVHSTVEVVVMAMEDGVVVGVECLQAS
jgi:hypothetical protein